MEDSLIVDLFLERNESAITETSKKYGKRLQTLAYGILKDSFGAEECENDAYLAAWNTIPPQEPRTYLFAYLARITRNAALDRCKSQSRQKRRGALVELSREMEECLPSGEDVQGELDMKLLGSAISRFLYGQSQEKRNVFIRRYWMFSPTSAIARDMGIGESKVKMILSRTRKKLSKFLETEGYHYGR